MASISVSRIPLIDAAKGLACMLIVWHHLAFYGPMSDAAYTLAPGLVDWLYGYGRMAVQVFLVVGGFLAAGTLAPDGVARYGQPLAQIGRRYLRLATPYLAALALAIVAAGVARAWSEHVSIPAMPTLVQLLAHVLLLNDLLGFEALSAGVWYVAIDFQLFVLAVLVFRLAEGLRGSRPRGGLSERIGIALVLVLTVLSLMWFNRQASLDTSALYFAGSYGLGMLAFWAGRSSRRGLWLGVIACLGLLALALDYRGRIAVALVMALGLGWLQSQPGASRWLLGSWLQRLGQMSYSVFLVHFPVCLLVNLLFDQLWPAQPWVNAGGMLLAFALSLLCGRWLYRGVEQRSASATSAWHLSGGLLATGVLVLATHAFG